MSVLIVAEKPSVAEDIARVLGAGTKEKNYWHGKDVFVTWAIGHLLELKTPEEHDKKWHRWTMEHLPIIPEQFFTKPKKDKNRQTQLKAIAKLAKEKSIDEIVNACDAAREGELIFWEIMNHIDTEIKCTRMWLQSMTKGAISSAFEGRRKASDFYGLRDAAIARAEADWIIGMTGSRAMSIRLPNNRKRSSYSIGRVQTPTLAIIASRETDHLSHVPEPYWNITADINVGEETWNAKWTRGSGENPDRITTQEELEKVESALESDGVCNVIEENKERQEFAPLSYDLTTLQRFASSYWGWTARETLSIAQSLYEEFKLTTYPRTDSKYLPSDMRTRVDELIDEISKQGDYTEHCNYLKTNGLSNANRNFNDSKVSDHYAIIPTGKKPPKNLSKRAKQLYDQILRRFLSSFHPHATWEDITRTATKSEQKLVAKSSSLSVEGWRAVIPKSKKNAVEWKSLPEGKCLAEVLAIEVSEKMTRPPSRMKDAGVLSAMENAGKVIEDDEYKEAISGKGLGTPATRANHLEHLINQEYIERLKGGSLRATPKAMLLIEVLKRIPVDWISSPELTGEMELRLKGVQEGDIPSADFMGEIKQKITSMVELVSSYEVQSLYPNNESLGSCPICEGEVYEGMLTYSCEKNERGKGCKFVIWKSSSGRYFDKNTAARLLNNRSIDNLHGFVSRSSEEFVASIVLNKDHKMEFVNQGPSQDELSNAEVFTDCKTCNSGSIRITETHWACDNEECRSRPLSRTICKREMTIGDAQKFYSVGETELIEDFISKKGRPFSAKLVNNNGRMKFEFPPRKNSAGSNLPRYEIADGVVGDYSNRGLSVPIIESATHFVAAENDHDITIEIPRTFAKRELLREECKTLVEKGEVGPLEGFVSKKGKPFSAKLVLNRNGSVKFRFN